MSECPSLEIQDLLPDFVVEQLDARTTAAVADHLRDCAVCRADVAVIRSARGIGVQGPELDTARIVAAVVQAGRSASAPAARPPLRVVSGGRASVEPPSVATTRSMWRRTSVWQRAAVLMLCVTGAVMTATTRGWGPTTPVFVDQQAGRAVPGGTASVAGSGAASAAPSATVASVSYGDLADYSEGELETMLATLEGWDGASRAEPEAFEPVLSPVGGNVP